LTEGVEIEIYADVVCPWCYLGKRRLEKALESYDGDVRITYRPFQLDPSPVEPPEPLVDAMARKFGGPERAKQIFAHTTGVAAGDGVELHFDRAVIANTFDAHRLVQYAAERGTAGEMLDTLYRAHFEDGVDVGSHTALAKVAAGAGLDEQETLTYLDSDAGVDDLRRQLDEAQALGVQSVPTFVFAGKYAVSGAQDPATMLEVLAEVERREG
jgi:predicted DsbA family dithiol-disulfide isomerase